jgi:hypothetical protein
MYGIRKNLTGWSEETYVAMLREAEHYYYAGYAWPDVGGLHVCVCVRVRVCVLICGASISNFQCSVLFTLHKQFQMSCQQKR